jgi:glycosyltransferase involved in cell wall biosynthesis
MTVLTREHSPIRLAAIAPAPVFYQTPLYRELAADPRVDLTVFFASNGGVRPYDANFGDRAITWDIDLLSGYSHRFLKAAETNDVANGFSALRDWDIVNEIRRGNFDAIWIHGFSYLTMWLAIATAFAMRTPVLLREEQTLLHERPWPKRWLREIVLRTLFRRVHALSIGSNNWAYFSRYGMSEDRLFFTPYCVDNTFLQAEARRLKAERPSIRARFGIPEDAGPVVLFVGKLTGKKQPLVALEAFARVRTQSRCALLFAGDGELNGPLQRRIAEKGIENVYFAGFLNRSEISEAYAVADLFVLPSVLHETWGLVVNEAMNFSLPVIVSDKVGSAADLVRHGENGLIVHHDDIAGFVSAISSLVRDSSLRRKYGARSLEIVSRWNYRLARDGIVDACRSAVRSNRRRSAGLRIAMFPMLPPINAATRAFCVRPLAYLEQQGISGRVFSPTSSRAFETLLRPEKRLQLMRAAIYWYGLALPSRIVQVFRAMSYDAIFIQRSMFRMQSPPILERLTWLVARRLLRKPLLYHCDDALYAVANERRLAARFRLADCVLTGNADIAAHAAIVNPNVVRFEGALEVSRYPIKEHRHQPPIVIGWVGHGAKDMLDPLLPVLRTVCDVENAVLKVVSDAPPGFSGFGTNLIVELWSLEREFALFEDFDIGIMPLADTPYNRGKEAYKIKEYMAAGLPVVCSPVGHNVTIVQHGVTGFFARSDKEWIGHLTRLIRQPELRGKVGAAGRRFVEEQFALCMQADRLGELVMTLVNCDAQGFQLPLEFKHVDKDKRLASSH